MARKNVKKGSQFSTKFIRYTLTAEDRKALPEYKKKNVSNFDAFMSEILGANHKVSFSFNETNDQYICSVTGKPEDCVNADLCYTSFAGNPLDAFFVACYKYFVVWEGTAWQDVDESSDFG